MAKKFSSFKGHQLITESWRSFINESETGFPMVDNPDGYVDLFAEFWDEERTYNDELEDDAQPDYDDVKMWASDQFSSNEAKKIASYVFNKLKGMKNI